MQVPAQQLGLLRSARSILCTETVSIIALPNFRSHGELFGTYDMQVRHSEGDIVVGIAWPQDRQDTGVRRDRSTTNPLDVDMMLWHRLTG